MQINASVWKSTVPDVFASPSGFLNIARREVVADKKENETRECHALVIHPIDVPTVNTENMGSGDGYCNNQALF